VNDQDIYLLFSEQFRTIDDNLDDLMRQAHNFVQANRIMESWKLANLNYLRARNKVFSSQLPRIGELVTRFTEAQAAIKASLAELQQGVATMDQMAEVIVTGVEAGKALQESV
jgi:hypothetical protein